MLMPTQQLFSIKEEKENRVKHRFSEPLISEDIIKKMQDAIPKEDKRQQQMSTFRLGCM